MITSIIVAQVLRPLLIEIVLFRNVNVISQGPAVTLKITNMNGREYSVDLTLAIRDKSWPEDAEEWRSRSRSEHFNTYRH